jgi:uncharacterized protein (DUF1501 family)
MPRLRRRDFLAAGALSASGALLASRLAFATTGADTKSRFVFVILRGALDGLAAVPPYADPAYAATRNDIALGRPGSDAGVLPLDGFFGLHPSLAFLQESYAAREALVFHAVASPYRDRSHFDGQNVLETGYPRPHAAETGWLNRALAAIPSWRAPERERGVSLAPTAPLVMRGPAAVTSWSPSHLAPLDDDTLQRISDLYSRDPILAKKLAEALAAEAIADVAAPSGAMDATPAHAVAEDTGGSQMARDDAGRPPGDGTLVAKRGKPDAQYAEVVRTAARFLRQDGGPQVAVFDTTGWDTHFNEGGAKGQLAGRLAALDAALRTLKSELGPIWGDTAVLLATEFGRTVAENGTRGTDHGTATAAFLVGGAVRGGRMVADWPGLTARALYQGRDLQPTLDLRSVMKGVLAEHLGVPEHALERTVFPDSGSAKPLRGLTRT